MLSFPIRLGQETTYTALDEGESLFFSHYDPATVEMLTGLVWQRKQAKIKCRAETMIVSALLCLSHIKPVRWS